jgi:hypothetical protein
MSNGQLLMDYGFVLERNPHDSVAFPMSPPFSSISPRKRALLSAHDLDRDRFLVLGSGEFPEHLLAAHRVLVATEQELDALEQTVAHPVTHRLPLWVSRRNELAALRLLASKVNKIRASYRGTSRVERRARYL